MAQEAETNRQNKTRKLGRPRACSARMCRAIFKAFLVCGRWLEAIEKQGISYQSFYEFLKAYPEFAIERAATEEQYRSRQVDIAQSKREELMQSGYWPAIEKTLEAYVPEFSKKPASVLNSISIENPAQSEEFKAALDENNRLLSDVIKRRQLALQPATGQESDSDQLWRAK